MPKSVMIVLLVAAALLAGPAAVDAQWGPRAGVGYVVNAPNQYVGVSAHVLTGAMGGLGLYVDGKVRRPSVRDRENFDPEITAQYVDDNFGDLPFGSRSEYVSFNGALLRPITPELMMYAGAGISERREYVEYLDEQRELGNSGFYWVEDTDAAGQGVNVIAGAFFRIARSVSLQFGIETQPRGATVGASYSFPLSR